MLIRALALALALSLAVPASAKVHRWHRTRPRESQIFRANHESVSLENEVADDMGAFRFFTQSQVDEAVSSSKLSALYNHKQYVVAPKLPINRRYALPATVKFVEAFSMEFFRQFNQPLMVDSAIRTATTQRKLLRFNKSAAPAYGPRSSSHERGCTIDLSKRMNKQAHQWFVFRLLYYRAIGRVLVIEEKKCWHILILPKGFVNAAAVLPSPADLSLDTIPE